MARFKSNYKIGDIEVPTSSLPDIIFMLLFFFMVTTVLKTEDDKIKYIVPEAEQLKKIEKRALVSEITIGIPKAESHYGNKPVIQAGNRILKVTDISQFIAEEKSRVPEYQQNQHIVLLKIDKDTDMGLVTDIQQALRKANARKIVYASLQNAEKQKIASTP